MTPTQPSPEEHVTPAAPQVVAPPIYRWYHKLAAVLLVSLCLYVGVFLVVFPWTDFWDINYFSQVVPQWHAYWGYGSVRGAVSALGLLNLYVAISEVFRLRRFSRRRGVVPRPK